MNVAAWTLSFVLAVPLSVIGIAKIIRQPTMVATGRHLGIDPDLYRFVGLAEIAGGVGLIVGAVAGGSADWIGFFAAIGLILMTVGAVYFHRRAGDSVNEMNPGHGARPALHLLFDRPDGSAVRKLDFVAGPRGVRNTDVVSTADTILRRVALVLSIVLVVLLAVIATISVFGADDQPEAAEGEVSPLDNPNGSADRTEDGDDEPDPASATALYPATAVQIRTDGSDVALSCAPVIGNSGEYLVSAENLGNQSRTLLVAVDLIGRDGDRAEAIAEVEGLEPNDSRNVPLAPDRDVGSIEECVITPPSSRIARSS